MTAQAKPTLADPAAAVAYLTELSPELRGCAILDATGTVLASGGGGDDPAWRGAAEELVRAADGATGEPAAHVHIATADGEVFMVRLGALTAVAATERFVLSSLTLFDLRAALRELGAAGSG
jgi:hypothetical protein